MARELLTGAMLIGCALSAHAQEAGCGGATDGQWSVLVTEIAVVELTSRQSIIPLQNHAEEKLVVVSFPTCQDCQTARNVALNSTSLTLPLGTGSAAQAHIGRTVSVCFKGGTK